MVALLAALGVFGSLVIVEVDEDLLNVLASGARCVSFSFLVSFQVEAIFATRKRPCSCYIVGLPSASR